MNKKIYLVIGIVIFILLTGSYFKITNINSNSNEKNLENIIASENKKEYGEIKYNGKMAMPVENFIKVTSKFGYRESHGVVHSNHTGIDLCGNIGSKVMAVNNGEITHSGWKNGYGNCVEIKHEDEQGNTYYTFYGHMRDNSLQVVKGQQVVIGQVIGIQGSTGNSTGDHLHFEIRKSSGTNKDAIDPAPYLFGEKER